MNPKKWKRFQLLVFVWFYVWQVDMDAYTVGDWMDL